MNKHPTPPPAPDDDPGPLLLAPLAQALSSHVPAADALQQRLARRVAAAQAADADKVTRRPRRLQPLAWAPGVSATELYRAAAGAALRPGEPLRAVIVVLEAGSRWQPQAAPGVQREWLLMEGAAQAGDTALGALDYLVTPPGHEAPAWHSPGGACLFMRESPQAADAPARPAVVRDAEVGWPAFAPGIERRVLWQHQGQAALLYRAAAGASVPRHAHGHDEECLMVRGELFLDDLLLQEGDYQLAPAGSGHASTATDVGAVLYAHGDLDLQFV